MRIQSKSNRIIFGKLYKKKTKFNLYGTIYKDHKCLKCEQTKSGKRRLEMKWRQISIKR